MSAMETDYAGVRAQPRAKLVMRNCGEVIIILSAALLCCMALSGLAMAPIGTSDWVTARIERADATVLSMKSRTAGLELACVYHVRVHAGDSPEADILMPGPCNADAKHVRVCHRRGHPEDASVTACKEFITHQSTLAVMVVGWVFVGIGICMVCTCVCTCVVCPRRPVDDVESPRPPSTTTPVTPCTITSPVPPIELSRMDSDFMARDKLLRAV